ncbi:MAG: hypothetical protein ACAH89_04035 [Rariglobus sp.]
MRTLLIAISMVMVSLSTRAEEGGPTWWWNCKQSDLVVRGKITCDTTRFYRITSPANKNVSQDEYYVCGTLIIKEVLYANAQSQHADEYRHYLRNIDQPLDILVWAHRIGFEHMKPNDIHLDPTVSGAFIPEANIFSLNVTYMFPIGGLVLQSSVPADKEAEALNLLRPRSNNLGKIPSAQENGASNGPFTSNYIKSPDAQASAAPTKWHPPLLSWPLIARSIKTGQTLQELVDKILFSTVILRAPGGGGGSTVIFTSDDEWALHCTFNRDTGIVLNHGLFKTRKPAWDLQADTFAQNPRERLY